MNEKAFIDRALIEHYKFARNLPKGISEGELAKQLVEILQKENHPDFQNMFVFYHGALPSRSYVFDILSIAHRLKHKDSSVVLRSSLPTLEYQNLEELYFNKIFPLYLTEQVKILQTTPKEKMKSAHAKLFEKDGTFHFSAETVEDFKNGRSYVRPIEPILQKIPLGNKHIFGDYFLCVNLFLFGNYAVSPGYSLAFYFNQKDMYMANRIQSLEEYQFEESLKKTLVDLGISTSRLEKYLDLYQKYFSKDTFEEGRFYQIFIDKDLVDKLCYICEGNGHLIALKEGCSMMKSSDILDAIEKNPQGLEDKLRREDRFQHRLFHTPFECFVPQYEHYHDKAIVPLLNLLQARLILGGDEFLEGQKKGKIKIFDYHLREIDRKGYFAELETLLREDLIEHS